MAHYVRPEDWLPVGVDQLEDNAAIVVRSNEHRSVIAGPGAGKTELLAQRAAYLLQTRTAKPPRRILAISFKRDAAKNLADRVAMRCHPDQARRLDSSTFDAFAKGLLDRFGQTLPERWRPAPNYQIQETTNRFFRDFLQSLGSPPAGAGTQADLAAISREAFQRDYLFALPLPPSGWPRPNAVQWAMETFWMQQMRTARGCFLSFPMISRLTELLLALNARVVEALRLTYSHVFLDEFQDTTQTQYDLMRRIFLGSESVVTAVGDNKQRIMRFAFAMEDSFATFERDFGAIRTPLFNNYRSSPELVRIQHFLAQALDPHSPLPISKAIGTVDSHSCVIWEFKSIESEATRLAAFVVSQITQRSLSPRDFVLIVRQKADDYAAELTPAFADRGISLRNEARRIGTVALQDLLPEDVCILLVQLMRVSTADRAGKRWSECLRANANLRGLSSDDQIEQGRLSKELQDFCQRFLEAHPVAPETEAEAKTIIADLLAFIGRERLIATHVTYRQGSRFKGLLDAAAVHLAESGTGAQNWSAALDEFEGLHSLPLMTIHKSKGLEYHTVMFIGLDDSAWWSFDEDAAEATSGFFVAFTRAKQRVIFTYCQRRGNRVKINSLYDLLRNAGVESKNVP